MKNDFYEVIGPYFLSTFVFVVLLVCGTIARSKKVTPDAARGLAKKMMSERSGKKAGEPMMRQEDRYLSSLETLLGSGLLTKEEYQNMVSKYYKKMQ